MNYNDSRVFKEFKELRDIKKKEYRRILPLNELFTDRWEKARYANAGDGTSIYDSSLIYGNVNLGKNVFVGPYTDLEGTEGIEIGDYCSISFGVQIYTHDSVEWCLTGGKAKFKKGKVMIGERTYLGPLAIVMAGVKIGKECIIGAHSLVNNDIPDNSIAFGIPAQVVGKTIVEGEKVILKYFKNSKKTHVDQKDQ